MEWMKLGEGVLPIAEMSSREYERNIKERKKEEKENHKEREREEEDFSSIVFRFGWIKNWSYTLQEVRDLSSLVISLFGAMEMAFG